MPYRNINNKKRKQKESGAVAGKWPMLQCLETDLVVDKLDLPPPEALKLIDLLLLLENLVVEVLLDLLVGKVDAELLEGVLLKDFESGNVENADEPIRVSARNGTVDPGHNSVEERLVNVLGQGITGKIGLLRSQGDGVGLVGATSDHHTVQHLLLEDLDVQTNR